ncbi:uncharacterized protein LOC135831286 [Planococcus citri]|uniref:uncharacterized protein LOC135831286 n=1 Tax=Planococcus citri TaxID=170843 RepID=UPI0031FA0C85
MGDIHRHVITRLRYQHNLGYKSIRKLYQQMYPGERVPAVSTIRNIIEKAEELDTYEDLRHYNKGRMKEDQHFAVIQAVIEQPTISIRQIEATYNVPKSSAINILKRYGFKSYKCHDIPHYREQHMENSQDHMHFLAGNATETPAKPRAPNKQNDRIWALEHPRLINKLPRKINGTPKVISKPSRISPIVKKIIDSTSK